MGKGGFFVRNERTLVERVVVSKAIEGELRTFDVDMHVLHDIYEVYVFDPDEAFEQDPFTMPTYEQAKLLFDRCISLIMEEPASPTESPFDFAERIYAKLTDFVQKNGS